MTPVVDLAVVQSGDDYVCFDAGPLISFNDTGRLGWLEEWFSPVAYTPQAVIELELKKRPKQNGTVVSASWLYWVPSHIDDAALVARLVRQFGPGPPENQGEAEVIAACKRHGWTAVLEDEDGRSAARDEGVTRVYVATLLAAAAAQGKLTPTQAWKGHVAIEKKRGRFSPLKPDDGYKPLFFSYARLVRKLHLRRGKPSLAKLLAISGLDDLLLRRIEEFKMPRR